MNTQYEFVCLYLDAKPGQASFAKLGSSVQTDSLTQVAKPVVSALIVIVESICGVCVRVFLYCVIFSGRVSADL